MAMENHHFSWENPLDFYVHLVHLPWRWIRRGFPSQIPRVSQPAMDFQRANQQRISNGSLFDFPTSPADIQYVDLSNHIISYII